MKEFQKKKKNPIQRKGKIVSIADARDRVGATTEQLILENRERVTRIEKWSKGEERKKERLSSIHNTTRWGTGSLVALSGDRKVARRNETAPRWLRGGIPVPREPYARQKRCRTRLRSLPHWYHPQYLSRSPDGDACLLHASPQPLLRYRFLQTPLIARRLKESFEYMR